MSDPSILLLDEPTLGLDVQAARTIKHLIQNLAGDHGKTIILTTHQLEIAQEVCHQIAIMSRGQLIANQPVRQLLALFRQEYYQIRLCGPLTDLPSTLLEPLTVSQDEEDLILTGPLSTEQLYALINQARDLGLTLISVNRVEPDLEEVFIRLVEAA